MAVTTDDHVTQPLGEGIEWIDLTPEVQRVRPRRTRWTALLLAGFAAMTGLGLAATNVMPHLTDRASERRDVGPGASAAPSAARSEGDQTVAVAGVPPAEQVAATNRIERSDGLARVFVAGASVAAGTRITVSLAVAGRTVATANPTPAASNSNAAADSKSVLAPWSAVLEVPLGTLPDDAVGTITVAWVDADGDGGSLASTVVLGDGRGVAGSQTARAH